MEQTDLGVGFNNLMNNLKPLTFRVKLQLHDAIYRLRFYSNSLTHILSLSNSHSNVVSIQKNLGDKSHRVLLSVKSQLNGYS